MNKRRLIEWGKSILILLLTASALWLVTMTPLVQDSGLAELFADRQNEGGSGSAAVSVSSVRPARMAVMGLSGRYGVQYDQNAMDELFYRFGSMLGDGLVSTGKPEEITETRWRLCMGASGVYFDFDRVIPLAALGRWFQPDGVCLLEDSARHLLLTEGEDDQVVLCYQSGTDGKFYACSTGLSRSLHLEPAIETIEGNGAAFAFEHEKLSALLQPYTMVTEISETVEYAAENPLNSADEVELLLKQLGFSDENRVPVSSGVAYLDGKARLEVGARGTVTFSDGHEGKYPVFSAGEEATAAELIEAAQKLAEMTIGRFCGEAQLYLDAVTQTENGWLVRFGYRLDGGAVWLYQEGWAAQFLIQDGCVQEFVLYFRTYEATENRVLLLPMDHAAVILPGLTDERMELVLRYWDRGGYMATPGWIAE